jgi:UDP-N-acetylmuramate dehydrogenase
VKALIYENVALAPMTTFGIGGAARYFVDAPDEDSALEAIRWAADRKLPLFVLGGGSNLLVADTGFSGLVVKVGIKGIDLSADNGKTIVRAGAGEEWDRLVALAVEHRLAGIECLSGIPGSVGGTPIQNVGAYGQEVSEVLVSVRAYDRQSDQIKELSHDECGFTYRTSVFNTVAKDRYIVFHVTFALTPNGAPVIRYHDVLREFQGETGTPTLPQIRAAVRCIRLRKAMLLVDGDPDSRSAGSFFKNPIMTEAQFAKLQSIAGPNVPRYPVDTVGAGGEARARQRAAPSDDRELGNAGKIKTAAAWLIEQAGFSRGYSAGPVGLSTKHTLALVNKGGATAEDVLRLAREIRLRVRDRFGVDLALEPVLLGFSNGVEI